MSTEEDIDERIAAGKRATSVVGFFAHPVVVVTGFMVAAAGAICVVIGLVKHEEELALYGGLDVVSAGGACFIAWMVARSSIARTVARELDWLEALPFTIEHHFALVGSGYATVEVTFRSAHPTLEEWKKLLEEASGDVLALGYPKVEARVFELSCKTVPAMPGGHRIWRAWRDVVEKKLVPLHARYAIESVRVVG